MGPTANARIDSEYFSGQDQLSTTQHAGVHFTKSKNKQTKKINTVRPWDARFLGKEKNRAAQNSCNFCFLIEWKQDD